MTVLIDSFLCGRPNWHAYTCMRCWTGIRSDGSRRTNGSQRLQRSAIGTSGQVADSPSPPAVMLQGQTRATDGPEVEQEEGMEEEEEGGGARIVEQVRFQ
eukprot:jgi/Tetstr1/453690/TSEL_040646.t1